MAEPLRRRLRAGVLAAMSRATGGVGDAFVRGILAAASEAARWTRYERIARDNLALALPELDERERARILRGVSSHTRRIVHEWLVLAGPRGRELVERVKLDDSFAWLEERRRSGLGTIVCTAHVGNWELLAARLRLAGLDGAVVGYRKRNDSSSDWLLGMRELHGVATLSQDASPRAALRILESGATLGLLCDLEVRRLAGELVPFFGRDALTMSAPAAMARASGLPLVPVRCVLRGKEYVLSVEPPLQLSAGRDRRAAQFDLLARLNATYERWIRETPEQWVWYRPRWSASSRSTPRR